ncbi:insulin-like growth factor-binding protein complex acid labile subunit [Schistocerca piceifrons]|uniref:insulin-like growth factor-binding protein complex acid labile subunit n=1 Tax=Schistocerca piceifrons TaxID=274613 RepID=UPI001F5F01AC|nr:insulin-like growth factor-binding protein complex acid labile subunit [Schistocerca piceifrons]
MDRNAAILRAGGRQEELWVVETQADTSPYAKAGFHGRLLWATYRLNGLTMVYPLDLYEVRLLDLSDNRIRSVHSGAFSNMRQLQRLSLARNILTELNKKVFSGLSSLEFIDLAQNQLKSLQVDSFTSVESLHFLNLSGNAIEKIEPRALFAFAPNLQVLDLSHNKLTTLEENVFHGLSGLTELYLSGNSLQTLDLAMLAPVDALQVLDVSGNMLDGVVGSGPKSVRDVRAGNNRLLEVQQLLAGFPLATILRVPDNAITSLDGVGLHNLVELDISGNPLSSLPAELSAPSLRRLVASRCSFESVPPQLTGDRLPSLEVLVLDGNKLLRSVFFPKNAAFLRLRYLSLSSLPLLQENQRNGDARWEGCLQMGLKPMLGLSIWAEQMADPTQQETDYYCKSNETVFDLLLKEVTAGAFDGLLKAETGDVAESSTGGDNCRTGTLQLRLSHNNMLSSLQPDSFQGLPLCTLDLSGNALETLDQTTVQWENLEWIDLQHNPWDCQCSLQWMVDTVVTLLYPTTHADLLYELRCSTPAALRGRRLVHFFNQSKPALCREPFSRMTAASDGDVNVSLTMGGSGVALGVILGLCVLLIILIVIGVALTWRRRTAVRRRNRRF